MVQCGQCPSCLAGRKNDWTGRLIAEALRAQSVYFLTLTYKDEPTEFVYADVQRMLYHLRTDLKRHHGGKTVRFFCVGERGNKKGRIHWHMLLFFDQPHSLRRMKPGEIWKYWPHGWTSIDAVPRHDTAQRIRYCAKYAVKKLGDNRACRARFSLKPAIGSAYVFDHAKDVADAGLPFLGWYRIPGITWSRGNKKGELIKFRLRGSCARQACKAYHYQWLERRPTKPWPDSNFMANYGKWAEEQKVFDERTGEWKTDRYDVNAYQERARIWPEFAKAKPFNVELEGRTRFDAEALAVRKMWARADEWTRNEWRITKLAQEKYDGNKETARAADEAEREERKRLADEWQREHAELAARQDRERKAVQRFAGVATHPAIREWIKTGRIPYNGYVEAAPSIIEELEALTLSDSVSPIVRKEYNAWAAQRFEARRAIWASGQDTQERIDPETGECEIIAVPRGQGDGNEALAYFPQAGGLAERARAQAPIAENKAPHTSPERAQAIFRNHQERTKGR